MKAAQVFHFFGARLSLYVFAERWNGAAIPYADMIDHAAIGLGEAQSVHELGVDNAAALRTAEG